jgi:hypothetical protein
VEFCEEKDLTQRTQRKRHRVHGGRKTLNPEES